MSRNRKTKCACRVERETASCQIETTLTIDDRGQMVLPKNLRERAGIKGGDKLALVSWEKNGEIESISILKADVLSRLINQSKLGGNLS